MRSSARRWPLSPPRAPRRRTATGVASAASTTSVARSVLHPECAPASIQPNYRARRIILRCHAVVLAGHHHLRAQAHQAADAADGPRGHLRCAAYTTQPLAPAPLLHLPLSSCSSTFSSCSFTFSSCSSTFYSCSSTSDGDTAPRAAWPRIPIWGARTPDQQTTAQSSCYDTRLRPGSVQPVQLINPLGNDADPEQLLHLAQGCLSENGTTAEGSACELYGTPDMTMEVLDSAQRGPVRTHRRAPARRNAPLCVPRAPHVAAQSLASGRLASPRVRTRPPASRPSRPARARASGSTPWRAGRTGGSSLTLHADPAASNQRQTYCSRWTCRIVSSRVRALCIGTGRAPRLLP